MTRRPRKSKYPSIIFQPLKVYCGGPPTSIHIKSYTDYEDVMLYKLGFPESERYKIWKVLTRRLLKESRAFLPSFRV